MPIRTDMRPPQAPATDDGAADVKYAPFTADLEVDVTSEICPMTYVRTRLALDRLQGGQILGVTLRGEEPARNVPETARMQGHTVLDQVAGKDGSVRVLIRKKQASPAGTQQPGPHAG